MKNKNNNLELNQIGWTTLFKDFCNNSSVFLQLHFATDLLWCKNMTWRTWGPNRPPLVQKCYMTDTKPQPTSFVAKTLHDGHRAPAANWPFRCLDVKSIQAFWSRIVTRNQMFEIRPPAPRTDPPPPSPSGASSNLWPTCNNIFTDMFKPQRSHLWA